ncbi:MAG: HAD family hydrolase [Acidobacteriota bacterium]
MSYRGILFDLDGTLVDTVVAWVDSWLATLSSFGPEITRERFLSEVYLKNRALGEVLESLNLDPSIEPEFRRRRDERYIGELANVSWLSGAPELLERARAQAPVAIVTAAWVSYVDAMDAVLDLRSRVDLVITADDTPGKHKPAPDGLLMAAERIGAPPEDCLYVGDQEFDMVAANRAGMESCFVRTDHARGHIQADRTIGGLSELRFD